MADRYVYGPNGEYKGRISDTSPWEGYGFLFLVLCGAVGWLLHFVWGIISPILLFLWFRPWIVAVPLVSVGVYSAWGAINDQRKQSEQERKEAYLSKQLDDKLERHAADFGDLDYLHNFDDLFLKAAILAVMAGSASTSMLQRRFKIGYTRAARLVDLMEQIGIVGPLDLDGAKPREVLVSTPEELGRALSAAMQNQPAADPADASAQPRRHVRRRRVRSL